MGAGKKIVMVLIVILLLCTVGAYAYGVYYFSSHFLPGSTVNGFNCSYMTAGEAESLLGERVHAYALAIGTKNNGQEGITAEDVGLSYQSSGSVQKLIKDQNRYKWFLAFGQDQVYDVAEDISYDEGKMTKAIDGLKCMDPDKVVQPVDAQIRDTGEKFEIVPEVEGNALDPLKVKQVIANAMVTGQNQVNLEDEACYLKPAVYSTDEQLIRNCEQMNQLSDVIITYDFADRTETVDRSVIADWFNIDQNGDVYLDETLVAKYVDALGYKYDTFGKTRTFLTYDNREITIEGGDYGWAIDQQAETKALIAAVESGETQVRQPVYAYSGWSRAANDIGYTYVEIDLTNQRLVFYKDGKPIIDTPVVTGNPNIDGCATPTGCFALANKKSPSVLTGEDYAAEVTYWMPFSGNVGIHDAVWRTEFGGNLYQLEGSHGCVNLPYDQAAALYSNVEIGMPVVVYQ